MAIRDLFHFELCNRIAPARYDPARVVLCRGWGHLVVENLVAIAVQVLPVNLLLSPRLERWGTLRFRMVLALLYLALPNTQEMPSTISESRWFLAFSALLLLTAAPARKLSTHVFEMSLFALCALTGPFSICLFPVAVLLWLTDRKGSRPRVPIAILLCEALVQAAFLLTHPAGRHYPALGASTDSFARILSSQIYLGTLWGGNGLAPHLSLVAAAAIALLATAVWIACFLISSNGLRALVILAVLLLCASLVSPTVFPPPGVTGSSFRMFREFVTGFSRAWPLRGRSLMEF